MANKSNIIVDLSTLLKIPNKTLDELTEKVNLCIGSAIHDGISAKEEVIQIGIGIGTLSISLVDMQCKFTPSKELKATIKTCLNTKVDPLMLELEQALAEKLINICEEAI
jgi:nucleoid DNA-binding protein